MDQRRRDLMRLYVLNEMQRNELERIRLNRANAVNPPPRRRRRRRSWVRLWILRRSTLGCYTTLIAELARESQTDFANFMRMEPNMFYEMEQRLHVSLRRQDTNYRKALEPGLKLAIALRYMATGDSYHSLAYLFRVPHNTISQILKEVARAIVAEYHEEVVHFPRNPAEWKEVRILFTIYYVE